MVLAADGGGLTGIIDAPWAYDANGTPVPTHYEISGDVLTQVVDHICDNYTYPITADPKVSWGLSIYVTFTKSETKQLAGYTSYAALTTAACAAISATGIEAIRAVVIGAVSIALDKSFNSAAASGRCIELRFIYVGFSLAGWKQVKC